MKVYSIVVNRLGMFRGISNDGQFFFSVTNACLRFRV